MPEAKQESMGRRYDTRFLPNVAVWRVMLEKLLIIIFSDPFKSLTSKAADLVKFVS
jgi:hypothetical protein